MLCIQHFLRIHQLRFALFQFYVGIFELSLSISKCPSLPQTVVDKKVEEFLAKLQAKKLVVTSDVDEPTRAKMFPPALVDEIKQIKGVARSTGSTGA